MMIAWLSLTQIEPLNITLIKVKVLTIEGAVQM